MDGSNLTYQFSDGANTRTCMPDTTGQRGYEQPSANMMYTQHQSVDGEEYTNNEFGIFDLTRRILPLSLMYDALFCCNCKCTTTNSVTFYSKFEISTEL